MDISRKIIAIIAFTFIIISILILIITPPANIYEISIYNVYPWYFWFFIVTSIFIGQLIILMDLFYNSLNKKNNIWLIGVIVIIIPIIIILALPVIRGYPTHGFGDHLTHIGIIKDILRFGHMAEDTFYPNLHFLTASLLLVSNWNVLDGVNFIPFFFFFLSPISMYLFLRFIFNKKNEMKLALLFTSSFLFFAGATTYLAPYYQSFLLIPIILYLYFRRETIKASILFSFLFIIMIVSFTFYHPINLLLLTLVFLFFTITFYLFKKITTIKLPESVEKRLKDTSINIVFFSCLLFIIWYLSYSSIIYYFNKVFVSIFVGTYESAFDSQVVSIGKYSPSLIDLLKITFYTYGLLAIIGLLVICSLVYIFIKWKRNKNTFGLKFYILYSIVSIIFFLGLIATSIFTDLIVGWQRFMLWAIIFSIILITFSFYSLLSDSRHHNLYFQSFKKIGRTLAVGIIIISLTFLSIFTFYYSPTTGEANLQVTKMDWLGTEWTFKYSNKTIVDQLGINQMRFLSAIYGEKEYMSIRRLGYDMPPDHFSYQNKTLLGEYYNESRYIIITLLGRIRYPESYPDYQDRWRFTPHDFDQLQNDSTVIRLYDNGCFESYFVKPSRIEN